MFRFKSGGSKPQKKDSKSTSGNLSHTITKELENNVQVVKEIFCDTDTVVERRIQNIHHNSIKCCIFYTDGLVDSSLINDSIVYPVQVIKVEEIEGDIIDIMMNRVLRVSEIKKTTEIEEIIQAIVYGDTVFFIHGGSEALIINTKSFALRSLSEPDSEKVIEGPREGFSEGMLQNLSLVRRRIRTPELKMKYLKFGVRTKTAACICYIDGIVNKQILNELKARLDKIDMDGVLDINYIIEMIQDAPRSPFKTIGFTERPDIVTAKLLEGRIALFLDGTPMVMTLPYLFIENLQSNEDYYVNYFYSAFTRPLRFLGFLITISLPALYISALNFHQELLPTPLLLSVSMAREGVPFPTVVETIGMLLMFQILTETGARMPAGIGQALSIVGALVIGQSAVEAKIVSAPVIIVISLTGITGLIIPKLKSAILPIRLFLLALSSIAGLFGFMFGMIFLLIHLLNIRSFGVPYITDIVTLDFQKNKDMLVRAPWWKMILRPRFIAEDKVRMKVNGDRGS